MCEGNIPKLNRIISSNGTGESRVDISVLNSDAVRVPLGWEVTSEWHTSPLRNLLPWPHVTCRNMNAIVPGLLSFKGYLCCVPVFNVSNSFKFLKVQCG